MKKFLSIVLAFALVLAMAVSAFAAEEVIYSVEKTITDNDATSGTVLADGLTLVGDWYSDKILTNWKDSAEWTKLMNALATEGATIKITYDGNVSSLGLQSDLSNDQYTVTGADGVVTVDAAAFLEACNAAVGGTYSWCNFLIGGDAGTVVTAIEVIAVVEDTAVEETPVEDTPVEETPVVEDTPVEETPAETGLALAVVPMIVAAAAIVVSKRR